MAVMGFDFKKMTDHEQGVVCFMEKFPLINIHDMLDKEGDTKSLEDYLRECFKNILKPLFIFSLCLFLMVFNISCADNMLSLTSAERRKYLAALESNKFEGCVASDPSGVV